MATTIGRVLIIAGSDSGGGAGIQADIKTVTALGGYAMTAITAITAQNTLGVHAVHAIPPAIVRAQIDVVLNDIGADVIKIGMLGDSATVHCVADALAALAPHIPLVLDPVMVAKGGHALLASDAVSAVRERLVPRAFVVTPNIPEAEALTGLAVLDRAGQDAAASALISMGARHALVKGGHLDGDVLTDVLAGPDGAIQAFSGTRLTTRATHGTGCTLASAIATKLAQGAPIDAAVLQAREYLLGAMVNAPSLGAGHGPLGHAWPILTSSH